MENTKMKDIMAQAKNEVFMLVSELAHDRYYVNLKPEDVIYTLKIFEDRIEAAGEWGDIVMYYDLYYIADLEDDDNDEI